MYDNNETSVSKASLICSIVSIFIFPFIFGIIGVVLGVIGISRQDEHQGCALAGIIISVISVLFSAYYYGIV